MVSHRTTEAGTGTFLCFVRSQMNDAERLAAVEGCKFVDKVCLSPARSDTDVDNALISHAKIL